MRAKVMAGDDFWTVPSFLMFFTDGRSFAADERSFIPLGWIERSNTLYFVG